MADQSDLPNLQSHLRSSLRRYPDFPKPGIMFEDILPIFASPVLHETLLQALELHIQSAHPPTLTPPRRRGPRGAGIPLRPGSCRVSVCAWRTRRSTVQIGSRCRWAPLSRGRGCWLSTILLPPGGARRLLGSWWGCWVGCSWSTFLFSSWIFWRGGRSWGLRCMPCWGFRRRRWGRRKRKQRRGVWRTSNYRWCTVNGRDGVIKVMLSGMGLDCSWGHGRMVSLFKKVFDSSHKCSQK
ncbi:unnamed protein product [Tuber melanosporum]|uniref:(Perigord truffle) hypothetical protein n=1 Tax=Tuber melanosporum (strain Mel28) TaxID=656061 RepID=D5GBG3_TUBMM|nr:uncharacterized protein GSTUM_00000460001 [Tuber melanosporum]CAZ81856.1 unnamed protein product [Tuber melanosporum]